VHQAASSHLRWCAAASVCSQLSSALEKLSANAFGHRQLDFTQRTSANARLWLQAILSLPRRVLASSELGVLVDLELWAGNICTVCSSLLLLPSTLADVAAVSYGQMGASRAFFRGYPAFGGVPLNR